MKFYISSYGHKKNVYQCNITDTGNIAILNSREMAGFPSYLSVYQNEISVALKKTGDTEQGGICILNKELKQQKTYYQEDSYTHVFQYEKYLLAASYHQGNIFIADKKTGNEKKIVYERAKIHQVGKLNQQEYYAIDLANEAVYIFKIDDKERGYNPTVKICLNSSKLEALGWEAKVDLAQMF